jgi:hypothetical protein
VPPGDTFCRRGSGLTGFGAFSVVGFTVMVRRSELPTVPPPFNAARFAKDSDAKLAAATPQTPEPAPLAESEMRLVTRPPTGVAPTDEAWARSMTGSPIAARPLDELKGMPLDHRAAYLLSWMDGSVDLETLAQVSTMPRAEVIRIVRDLYESGIVDFR